MPPRAKNAIPFKLRPYIPSPTMQKFHNDNSWGRAIRGPWGSGKSSGCVNDVAMRISTARVLEGTNIRSTKGVFIRSTYNRLWNSTVPEWLHWIPEPITTVRMGNPPKLFVRYHNTADDTIVESEILLIAADDADSASQLRSTQLTFAWINEISEIKSSVVLDELEPRIGRYPSVQDGGPSWRGVMADTNSMAKSHWYYNLAEVAKPLKWHFYSQPPAVLKVPGTNPPQYVPNQGQLLSKNGIPTAENIQWLDGGYGYYMNLIQGRTHEWIRVYLMNEYGSITDGEPVFWEYNDTIHGVEGDIEVQRALPIIMGVDFGVKTACAVFCQLTMRGCLNVIKELYAENTDSRQFANEILAPYIRNNYGGMQIIGVGDPSGEFKNKTNAVSDFDEFAMAGIPLQPAATQQLRARRSAVGYFLQRQNGFQISRKNCPVLVSGFLGEYCFEKSTSGAEPIPEKRHPVSDCLSSGTKILMHDMSEMNIEDVKIGMSVMTPNGPRTVTNHWLKSNKSNVVEYSFSNGETIIATKDHKIFSSGRWIAIEELQYGDVLLSIKKGSRAIWESGLKVIQFVGKSAYPTLKPVYDMTVDGEHCFFANGVLVHNCHDSLQAACMEARQVTCGRSYIAPESDPSSNQSRASARQVKVISVGNAYA